MANPIANGFESVVLLIILIKNVDHINYVHYNVQRRDWLILTRNPIAGLSEQLASTLLMPVQNSMALDMLLVEKGRGVFNVWFGLLYVYYK